MGHRGCGRMAGTLVYRQHRSNTIHRADPEESAGRAEERVLPSLPVQYRNSAQDLQYAGGETR